MPHSQPGGQFSCTVTDSLFSVVTETLASIPALKMSLLQIISTTVIDHEGLKRDNTNKSNPKLAPKSTVIATLCSNVAEMEHCEFNQNGFLSNDSEWPDLLLHYQLCTTPQLPAQEARGTPIGRRLSKICCQYRSVLGLCLSRELALALLRLWRRRKPGMLQ